MSHSDTTSLAQHRQIVRNPLTSPDFTANPVGSTCDVPTPRLGYAGIPGVVQGTALHGVQCVDLAEALGEEPSAHGLAGRKVQGAATALVLNATMPARSEACGPLLPGAHVPVGRRPIEQKHWNNLKRIKQK